MNKTESKISDGILLINKPKGITSHDAVVQVRRAFPKTKVGHTGTLDPAAEGLLVVCIGKGTKIAQFLTANDKTYRAKITLGRSSKTYDEEGVDFSIPENEIPDLNDDALKSILSKYTGLIEQKVPAFSAVRVDGQRLHELARQNIETDLPTRKVTVYNIELIDYSKPILEIEISCSKGTYIRTLANDIGNDVKCGAYLSGLIRTKVGQFDIKDSISIKDLKEKAITGDLNCCLKDISQSVSYSSLIIKPDYEERIFQGQPIHSEFFQTALGDFCTGDYVSIKTVSGSLIAVVEAMVDSNSWSLHDLGTEIFKYVRVIN